MSDRWETRHGLNTHRNDARGDRDHDGLTNLREFRTHNDPRDSDTDNDGIKDGEENAGTVKSFDGTRLVISTPNGDVAGDVTAATELKCDGAAPAATAARHGSDDSGDDDSSDSSSGPGSGSTTTPATDPVTSGGADDPAGHDAGDDNGDDTGDDNASTCGKDKLVPGVMVHEADLELHGATQVWDEVELVA
jgi:hypothetical protein